MPVNWSTSHDKLGIWTWATPYFPNCWCASVTDDSQSIAPKQPTRYTANAICRWWIVTYPKHLDTLSEAKSIAVLLARAQRQASADPNCRVEVAC